MKVIDAYGNTELHQAASHYTLDVLSSLLRQEGLDVNVTNQHGDTPLIEAAKARSIDKIQILLTANADVNKVGQEGTALYHATLANSRALVQLLLEARADPTIKAAGKWHSSPLETARTGHYGDDMLQLLRQAVVDQGGSDIVGDIHEWTGGWCTLL